MYTAIEYYIMYLALNLLYLIPCDSIIHKYGRISNKPGFIGYSIENKPPEPYNRFIFIISLVYLMGYMGSNFIVGYILGTLKQLKDAFIYGQITDHPSAESLQKNLYRNKVITGFIMIHFGLFSLITSIIFSTLIIIKLLMFGYNKKGS